MRRCEALGVAVVFLQSCWLWTELFCRPWLELSGLIQYEDGVSSEVKLHDNKRFTTPLYIFHLPEILKPAPKQKKTSAYMASLQHPHPD